MKTYIIHWTDGSKSIIKGTSFINACNNDYILKHKGIRQDIEKWEEIEEYTYPPNISSEVQENKDYKIVMQFFDEASKLYHALKYNNMLPITYQEMLNELSKDLCTKIRNNK